MIVDIEAGNGVMAALTKYHQVYIWGNDQTGMLGLGGEVANVNDQANGNDFQVHHLILLISLISLAKTA